MDFAEEVTQHAVALTDPLSGPSSMEHLILPGVLSSLADVTAFVTRQAEAAGLDERATHRLLLAMDELVTNIILHGYKEQGLSGDIVIRAELTPDTLTISTEDTAVPFDPSNRPDPASLTLSLEDRPIGGVGIFLMFKSVDQVQYTYREGKNCNRLVMTRTRG